MRCLTAIHNNIKYAYKVGLGMFIQNGNGMNCGAAWLVFA